MIRGVRGFFGALAALLGAASIAAAQTPPQPRLTIGYVEVAGDPRYEPITGFGRLVLKQRERPFTGAQVGLDEAQALSRVLKIDFALERITVNSPAEVAAAVSQARAARGIQLFILDAPVEAFRPLADAIKGRDVLVFNATATDDTLRRDLCAAEFVHALPSLAMGTDGLVQYLASRKWNNLLVFEGPLPADAVMVKALENSAKKFGARVVARQQFKPGTDPREREKNDPALLSAINRDYDVVFVADHAFDFARQVPYHTVRARPVVGSIDLEPMAWHWTWEHNGAPQVNSRFQKLSGGRHMESADWAAWIAVKMVVQAALRTRSAEFDKLRKFILGEGSFDGNKGLALSVRPWDHQLRQAILLAAPYSVIARAPVEGFLHKTNDLDTLGDDEPESPCRLNR
ncbi:MAG TPA: amino acid ABC transporter substrate-binding protein [Xanthobacteraceae bacterium]|nr:amino acid ABC transporter substrate-binding protein [Xanthobacteraceae bacterium]